MKRGKKQDTLKNKQNEKIWQRFLFQPNKSKVGFATETRICINILKLPSRRFVFLLFFYKIYIYIFLLSRTLSACQVIKMFIKIEYNVLYKWVKDVGKCQDRYDWCNMLHCVCSSIRDLDIPSIRYCSVVFISLIISSYILSFNVNF